MSVLLTWLSYFAVASAGADALSAATFEHLQHAIGDPVASDDIRAGECHGHEGDDVRQRIVCSGSQADGADQHDPVDRVGARHQRRVKSCRHFADDFESEKDRQNEDGQVVEKCADVHALTPPALAFCNSPRVACWTTIPS
jgi:hypothetical protein